MKKPKKNPIGRAPGQVNLEPWEKSRRRVARVLTLRDKGLGPSEIARKIGISPQAVSQLLARWGNRPRMWMQAK